MAPQDDKNNVAKGREVIGYVTLIMSQLSRSVHLKLGKLTSHLTIVEVFQLIIASIKIGICSFNRTLNKYFISYRLNTRYVAAQARV